MKARIKCVIIGLLICCTAMASAEDAANQQKDNRAVSEKKIHEGTDAGEETKRFAPEQLRADLRQLMDTLESAHPDPYLNGGGKIAFHRRFHHVLKTIPETGWTREEFYSRLLPLLASIGDSHTALLPLMQTKDAAGLPFSFKVVDRNLFIETVAHQDLAGYLGARLSAVEGHPLSELLDRQAKLRGAENDYTRIVFLCYSSLRRRSGLKMLLPEWSTEQPVHVTLELNDGRIEELALKIPIDQGKPCSLSTTIELPPTDRTDFSWTLLEGQPRTALLVIKGMEAYREGFENLKARGYQQVEAMAAAAYRGFNGGEPPKEWEKILAGIPSAGECFIGLIRAMKKAQSDTLIIDLRRNTGGNSIMSEILIYLLCGEEASLSRPTGYVIVKDSPLRRSQYNHRFEKDHDGYDFSSEERGQARAAVSRSSSESNWQTMPSFWNVVRKGVYKKPQIQFKRIFVLCSLFTYSSGFNLLTALKDMGAETVGTPSGQAPNNFGDALSFRLEHSQLQGYISYKRIVTYPDALDGGKLLAVDHPLSLQQYAAWKRDPNSELLLALKIIEKNRNNEGH